MSSSFRDPALSLAAIWRTEAERADGNEASRLDLGRSGLDGTAQLSDKTEQVSSEEALLRLRGRDKAALGLLFDRYAALVFSIGFRILRDHGEAEDLMQNVFLYLWEKSALYDPEKSAAKAWIMQKCYSRALDRRDYLNYRQTFTGTNGTTQPDFLPGSFDLEREIGSRLNREQLLKALEELPERQRQTLTLSFFEGLDMQEIGERLGEPVKQVRHHYYRGLNKLRRSTLIQNLRGESR